MNSATKPLLNLSQQPTVIPTLRPGAKLKVVGNAGGTHASPIGSYVSFNMLSGQYIKVKENNFQLYLL